MTDNLSKIIRWILIALLAVSAVLGALFYVGSITEELIIQWGYVLVALTAALAIISPIYGFIINPKNAVKLLIYIAALVVIGIVAYSLAGNTFSELKLEKLRVTEQVSVNVGMGLYYTYITTILALVAIVFSGVYRIFK